MTKNNDQEKANVTNKQAQHFNKNPQMVNSQENAVTVDKDTMQSSMKDLQQKIKDAKNSENREEVIQNAVFEMMQNMGLNIPSDMINKMKSKMRGEK
jgi:hypothetical protein